MRTAKLLFRHLGTVEDTGVPGRCNGGTRFRDDGQLARCPLCRVVLVAVMLPGGPGFPCECRP